MEFSILVPAYKTAYLSECIDSVLAQTCNDFEIIIVNDASPHDLDSIVNGYKDSRIKYYKNEVGFGAEHVVGNWNKCLEYAMGDYVVCMGDDDRLLPNCLEEYSKLIGKYPGLSVYHALTEMIDEKGQFIKMQEPRPEREGVFSMMYGRLYGNRQQFIGDWLFNTKWLKHNNGFIYMPMAWGSDDLTAYTAAFEKGVANSQIPLFQYRINSQTISNSGNTLVKFKAMLSTFQKLKELLETESSDSLDEKYRLSCKKIISETFKARTSVAIQQDMIACGKIKSLIWWLKHSSDFGFSQKEVLKAAIKTINK